MPVDQGTLNSWLFIITLFQNVSYFRKLLILVFGASCEKCKTIENEKLETFYHSENKFCSVFLFKLYVHQGNLTNWQFITYPIPIIPCPFIMSFSKFHIVCISLFLDQWKECLYWKMGIANHSWMKFMSAIGGSQWLQQDTQCYQNALLVAKDVWRH